MSGRLIKGVSCRPRTIGNAALHKEICISLRRFSFQFAWITEPAHGDVEARTGLTNKTRRRALSLNPPTSLNPGTSAAAWWQYGGETGPTPVKWMNPVYLYFVPPAVVCKALVTSLFSPLSVSVNERELLLNCFSWSEPDSRAVNLVLVLQIGVFK